MPKMKLILFIKSEKISTSSADIDSLGHQCANPMRTGAHNRMGGEIGFLSNVQLLLLDAATRACEKMNWDLELVDVSKYSLMKRIRMKETVPRLECNGKIMTGTPTSDEIIQFLRENEPDSFIEKIDIKLLNRMVEAS
ncbi:MAG: hypothetical protein ACXAEF_11620 [Candidatus Thorarchaeota archaeon]|jgi:hypothetical protein